MGTAVYLQRWDEVETNRARVQGAQPSRRSRIRDTSDERPKKCKTLIDNSEDPSHATELGARVQETFRIRYLDCPPR